DSPQRKTIIDAIGTMPSASQKKELQRIFQDSKSIDNCLELVKQFSSQAISHLQKLPESQYRSLLERIPQMYIEELLKSMDDSKGE
ncbi:MAG: hypothetical protein QNJ51_11925, partial [Calothrix sp. MO_167.B12]|nr:hypothetical protein [Calothrix sp. MO_167.B12]